MYVLLLFQEVSIPKKFFQSFGYLMQGQGGMEEVIRLSVGSSLEVHETISCGNGMKHRVAHIEGQWY